MSSGLKSLLLVGTIFWSIAILIALGSVAITKYSNERMFMEVIKAHNAEYGEPDTVVVDGEIVIYRRMKTPCTK